MNLPQVARLIAGFAGLFSLAQVPALATAIGEQPHQELAPATGFAVGLGVGVAAALLLRLIGRRDQTQIFRRETIAVAGLSWFLAGLIGAVPFWVSGLLSPVDAFFEAMSGLTTCGATVLGSGGNLDIEATPASLLLWRATLQWVGGAGIVLIFVALLPAVGVSAKNLLSSESVGVATESYQPRAVEKARNVGIIYAGMTALCTLLLVLVVLGAQKATSANDNDSHPSTRRRRLTGMSVAEAEALAAFYVATGGATWGIQWSSRTPTCASHGIKCSGGGVIEM